MPADFIYMDQIAKDVCTGVEILKNILVAYQ
jgi:hypothetical protein